MSTALLARVPLFAQVPEAHLATLAGFLRQRRYAAGETIFRQGDPGDSLCIISAGQVKISLSSSEGKEAVLALLGPGDFFGELALIDGKPRSADAVAREPSELLILPREDFLRCLREQPQLAGNALAALSRRLRRTDQIVHDAVFLDIRTRLARALLQLAGPPATPDGTRVTGRLTQSELAGIVGATRESVNKWLKAYEREGLLRIGRGRITLLDPQRLRREALDDE